MVSPALICEACKAPRSEQAMQCTSCGYRFKTQPVPTYPPEAPKTERHAASYAPTIVEQHVPFVADDAAPTHRGPIPPPSRSDPTLASSPWQAAPSGPRSDPRSAPTTMASPVYGSQPPPQSPSRMPPPSAPRAVRRKGVETWVWVVCGLIALCALSVVGVAVVVLLGAARPASGQRLVWDPTDPRPATTDVNGDGIEDIVGRARIRHEGADDLHVVAIDGKSFRRLWTAGPFGSPADPGAATHHRIVGAHLLVADPRSMVHVHDLRTGREIVTFKLAEPVRSIAASPTGEEAAIDLSDESVVVVDLKAMKAAPAPRPAWSTALPKHNDPGPLNCVLPVALRSATCLEPARVPATAGFVPEQVLAERGRTIAIAIGKPAPELAEVVGFSLEGKSVAWRSPVPGKAKARVAAAPYELADVVGGRLYVEYRLEGDEARLTSFEVSSGTRRWDVSIKGPRGGARAVTATPSRVYLGIAGKLVVLDAATGAVLGSVGDDI